MGFSRLKNFGLSTLVLVLIAICLAAWWQAHTVGRHLAQVQDRYLPAMATIHPVAWALEGAHERFRDHHRTDRIIRDDVLAPLQELEQTVSRIAPLLQGGPAPARQLAQQVRAAARHFITRADAQQGHATDTHRPIVNHPSANNLRHHLRLLATDLAPGGVEGGHRLLRRASHLLRVAEEESSRYLAQEPSALPWALARLDTARARLDDLAALSPSPRVMDRVALLQTQLAQLRALVQAYQDDEHRVHGDASADTLRRIYAQSEQVWQEASTTNAWISHNLQVDIWRLTASASTTTRRGEWALLLLGLIGVAVAGATAVILSRSMTRHVDRLATATSRFAAGSYEQRLPADGDDVMATLETSLNQMVDQLQQRESDLGRLAAAVEHATDGIVISTPGGRIEYVNPAFVELSGHPAHPFVGCQLQDLPERDRAYGWVRHLQRVADSAQAWTGKHVARPNGAPARQQVCTIYPVPGPDDTTAHMVVLVRDITREVQIEERVKESQKLQALGTLAGGIAHDFNNLLVPILGYAEMLLAKTAPEDPARRRLQHIAVAAERAKELVEQVLIFSRAKEKEKHPLQLSALAKEVVRLVSSSIPGNITVDLQVSPDPAPVLGDPVQIHQALMNLLTNAVHAMEAGGGTLEVSIERATMPEQDSATDALMVSIRDSGCGMAPELVGRIFEPFFTTKGVGKGTGLGLSVVHGIVEDHAGHIEVDSTPGKGTCFRLYFPTCSDTEEVPVVAPIPPPEGGSERLLLVEDDAPVAEVLQSALEGFGYTVQVHPSAPRALEWLAADTPPVDLVVTDQRMPGMTGSELIAELKQRYPSLPAILCTGHYLSHGDETVDTSGAEAVVYKPVRSDELARVVRQTLDRVAETGKAPHVL